MTVLSFFGCLFIAYGPSLAMFTLTVAPDAQQVIVLISRFVHSTYIFSVHNSHTALIY